LLGNHFYIGEVKYKGEILPGEQPPIMDRALFEAVRQKSLAQWSHRTLVRNKSDHLLTGLPSHDSKSRPELIAKPEVARSLEQEMLHALVNCLTAEDSGESPRRRRHSDRRRGASRPCPAAIQIWLVPGIIAE